MILLLLTAYDRQEKVSSRLLRTREAKECVHMVGYLIILIIALGVVLMFGYGSRFLRLRSQSKKKIKTAKVYPLTKVKKQSNLRRVK